MQARGLVLIPPLMPFYCCQTLLVADKERENMNYYRNSNRQITQQNGYRRRIISKEMAFYCFDLLASHLYRLKEPARPLFTNEPL